MNTDKAKEFVNYGEQNYISLNLMRFMVPSCYIFFAFISCIAAIAGDKLLGAAVVILEVFVYSIIVYTFNLWCPNPSYRTRFAANAFCIASTNFIFQSFIYTVLCVGEYISLFEISIIAVLQLLSSIIYFFVTKHRIRKGKYTDKKSAASLQTNGAIIGSASLGYILATLFLEDLEKSAAIILLIAIITGLSVFFSIVTTFNLMKLHYCVKYNITCAENGETTSPLLTIEPTKKSLLRKIWSFLWRISVLSLLAAIVYGFYKASG